MKDKNRLVGIAQAIGVLTYLSREFDGHYNFDCSESKVVVCVFCHSLLELTSISSRLRPFLTDGVSTKSDYFEDGQFWTYEIEWHFVWSGCK